VWLSRPVQECLCRIGRLGSEAPFHTGQRGGQFQIDHRATARRARSTTAQSASAGIRIDREPIGAAVMAPARNTSQAFAQAGGHASRRGSPCHGGSWEWGRAAIERGLDVATDRRRVVIGGLLRVLAQTDHGGPAAGWRELTGETHSATASNVGDRFRPPAACSITSYRKRRSCRTAPGSGAARASLAQGVAPSVPPQRSSVRKAPDQGSPPGALCWPAEKAEQNTTAECRTASAGGSQPKRVEPGTIAVGAAWRTRPPTPTCAQLFGPSPLRQTEEKCRYTPTPGVTLRYLYLGRGFETRSGPPKHR